MQRSFEHARPSGHGRRWRVTAPFVVGALALAACGSSSTKTAPATTTPATAGSGVATAAAGSSAAATTAASGPGAGTTTPGTTAGGAATTAGGAATTAAAAKKCDVPASAAAAATPAPTTAPPSGSGESVVVGAVLEPTTLDIIHGAGAAIDQVLLDNVYETLLKSDKDGKIIPGVAKDTVSADAKTITLKLQSGVTFSDGHVLTSADVVCTLQAFAAKDGTGAVHLASITSVTATDPGTVTISLSNPDNDLLFYLTQREGAVIGANATGLEKGAIGTGPFKLKEWNTGTSITLVRNESYWAKKPQIAGVIFRYIADPNAAVNALKTGDVNILTNASATLVDPLKADYTVTDGSSNGEFTLGFNNAKPYLSDVRVRKAIREAIDKKGLLQLENGYGTLIGGPVPPTDPWYEDLNNLAPYNPADAKALLTAAGHATDLNLTFVYPNVYAANIAEYVVSQLKAVGITVTVKTVTFADWFTQVYTNHDYDLTAVDHAEARDMGNYANPKYYWLYDSPTVQKLMANAKTETDQAKSIDLLKQAAKQISTDSPADWLFLLPDISVAQKNISGYPTDNIDARFDASGIVVS